LREGKQKRKRGEKGEGRALLVVDVTTLFGRVGARVSMKRDDRKEGRGRKVRGVIR